MSVVERSDQVSVRWSTFHLSSSFPDILEQHGDSWTVRSPETGIFGSGPDPQAAYDDFRRALREHFEVLSAQDSLSEALEAQLLYLKQRLT
jgi:hypothetical protein